jgi:hypothetical protein
MSTEEGEKLDKEVTLTRRAAIKAGWAVPIILAIGLGGNAFVHATSSKRSRGRVRSIGGGIGGGRGHK